MPSSGAAGCWLSLLVVMGGCAVNRAPTADEAPDAGAMADAASDMVAPPDAALPDAALPDAATPDPEPTAPVEPEPVPDGPPNLTLLGFSADGRYLFVLDVPPQDPDLADLPTYGTLMRQSLASGAREIIDDRVVLQAQHDQRVRWSDDGETVTYGRIARRWADTDPNARWMLRAMLDLSVWRADSGPVHLGLTENAVLAPTGRHLLTWPWEGDGARLYDLVRDTPPRALPIPRRFEQHAATGQVFWTRDGAVERLDLDAGTLDTLVAADGRLIGLRGDQALLDEAGTLTLFDVRDGSRVPTPIAAPTHVSFLAWDRASGRLGVGIGVGVYGTVRLWTVGAPEATELPLPAPREAGGQTKAIGLRFHADGLAYYPQAGWLDHDLWDLRDDTARHVVANHCQGLPLADPAQRVVVANARGCSTQHASQLYLYDEAAGQLEATGREARYVRRMLAGDRVVYSRETDEGLETVIWDVAADTTTRFGIDISLGLATRRDGTWMVGTRRTGATSELIVLHPDGLTTHALDGVVRGLIADAEHVAWVLNTAAGDALFVEPFERLASP